jgi:hypothetical protein
MIPTQMAGLGLLLPASASPATHHSSFSLLGVGAATCKRGGDKSSNHCSGTYVFMEYAATEVRPLKAIRSGILLSAGQQDKNKTNSLHSRDGQLSHAAGPSKAGAARALAWRAQNRSPAAMRPNAGGDCNARSFAMPDSSITHLPYIVRCQKTGQGVKLLVTMQPHDHQVCAACSAGYPDVSVGSDYSARMQALALHKTTL